MTDVKDILAAALKKDVVQLDKSVTNILSTKLDTYVSDRYDDMEKELLNFSDDEDDDATDPIEDDSEEEPEED